MYLHGIPVRVHKHNIGDGDYATEETVRRMREIIREAMVAPMVRGVAERLVGRCRERSHECEIKQIFNFVKMRMRFTLDPYRREFFKAPELHLEQISRGGLGYGDCDDFSVVLGALLMSVGYPVRIVVIQSAWNVRGGFNHVFVEVRLNGAWRALDATAKDKSIFFRPESIRSRSFEV